MQISTVKSFSEIINEINKYLKPDHQIHDDYICDLNGIIYKTVEDKLRKACEMKTVFERTYLNDQIKLQRDQIAEKEGANGDLSRQIDAQR